MEVLGVGSHVVVSDDGGGVESVIEGSGVGEDDDFSGGGSSAFKGFTEVASAAALFFERADVAEEISLLAERREQVEVHEWVSPLEDDSDLALVEKAT